MKPGDTVYALRKIGDSPSGDSPGGVYADFGTELIIISVEGPFGDEKSKRYYVCHPDLVQTKQRFYAFGWEISKMKHFSHNKPVDWFRRDFNRLHTF